MKLFIALLALITVIMVGGAIATYVMAGVLMFAGLVALVESIPLLKWIFRYTSSLLDVLIFGFSIYGLAHMGATVSIGMSVCGLLFTLIYKPVFLNKRKTVTT